MGLTKKHYFGVVATLIVFFLFGNEVFASTYSRCSREVTFSATDFADATNGGVNNTCVYWTIVADGDAQFVSQNFLISGGFNQTVTIPAGDYVDIMLGFDGVAGNGSGCNFTSFPPDWLEGNGIDNIDFGVDINTDPCTCGTPVACTCGDTSATCALASISGEIVDSSVSVATFSLQNLWGFFLIIGVIIFLMLLFNQYIKLLIKWTKR